jgi:hypothetical protein
MGRPVKPPRACDDKPADRESQSSSGDRLQNSEKENPAMPLLGGFRRVYLRSAGKPA